MSNSKGISLFIKLFIVATCCIYIYNRTFSRNDIALIKEAFAGISTGSYFIYFSVTFFLMLLNWGIEAFKWRMLVSRLEEISFADSLKAILTGITVSIFTPNRAGEFGGRIFFLEKADRIKAILVTFIGSFSQLLITIITGSIAIFFYGSSTEFSNSPLFYAVIILLVIFVSSMVGIYLNIMQLPESLTNWKWAKKLEPYIDILNTYSKNELYRVLGLSMLRYVIFTIQFFLLLKLFGVEIDFLPGLMMIALTFFAISAVPTIALTEIVVRGSAALTFIGMLSNNNSGIIAASFSLWLINIVLPAIAGMRFVFRLKFFRPLPLPLSEGEGNTPRIK